MRCLFYSCLILLVISIAGLITTSILYSKGDVKSCALNCTVAMDYSTRKCYLVHPDNGVFNFPYRLNQIDEKIGSEMSCNLIDRILTCYYVPGLFLGVVLSAIGVVITIILILVDIFHCRTRDKYDRVVTAGSVQMPRCAQEKNYL